MEIKGKKILITGGCGFIGLNLIDHLQWNYDCEISVLDNLTSGSPLDLPDGIKFIRGDICKLSDCWKATIGQDVVVHLAANVSVPNSINTPTQDAMVNVTGTLHVLECSKLNKIQKFIFASSGAVVGDDAVPPIHEKIQTNPMSPYGVSKLACEKYCQVYMDLFDLKTVSLRFSNAYGLHSSRKESVIPKFIKKIMKGEPIEIYGDGEQTRDFIYAEDVSRAIVSAIQFLPTKYHRLFQIATGTQTSINDLTVLLHHISPHRFSVVYNEGKPGEVRRSFSDITLAREILDWIPEYDIKEGIQEMFKAYLGKENE